MEKSTPYCHIVLWRILLLPFILIGFLLFIVIAIIFDCIESIFKKQEQARRLPVTMDFSIKCVNATVLRDGDYLRVNLVGASEEDLRSAFKKMANDSELTQECAPDASVREIVSPEKEAQYAETRARVDKFLGKTDMAPAYRQGKKNPITITYVPVSGR